jgi:hypothetical protein
MNKGKPKVSHSFDGKNTHIEYDICSVAVTRTDEGIVVDIWESGFAGSEPVATTWAHENDFNLREEV